MKRIIAFWLFACALASGEIIDSTRRVTWAGNAGVSGGIPARTTVYTTLTSSATPADIATAISDCPEGEVVLLAAGTYNFGTSTLTWPSSKSNVTLRGAGVGQTIIQYSGTSDVINVDFGGSAASAQSVTAGATKGSTTITVASAAGFAVGAYFAIRHTNPAWCSPVGTSGTITWASHNASTKTMSQMCKVVSKSGNDITIEIPLYFDYVNSPEALALNTYGEGVGIEDMTIQMTSTSADGRSINFEAAANSWAYRVKTINTGAAHIRLYTSYRCEIRKCWADSSDAAFSHGGSDAYGYFIFDWNSAHLIVDNIIEGARHSLIMEAGGSGNVTAYNYTVASKSSDLTYNTQDLAYHGACPFMNLNEGNYVANYTPDNVWGSSGYNTLFRCYVFADSSALEGDVWGRFAVNIHRGSPYHNVVGNVLLASGDTGIQYAISSTADETKVAYRLGAQGVGTWAPHDTTIMNMDAGGTTYIHGTYDFISGSIVWNSSNADHTIPDSLFLSSKPSWFYGLSWPAFSSATPAAATPDDIPAGYRYLNAGADPPADADVTAPTPSPMSFASVPASSGSFSVVMTASTATDASGSVEYYFDETSGHAGATDSGWQSSVSYADPGLSPNTQYSYRVKARDPSLNETSFSITSSTTTDPVVSASQIEAASVTVGTLRSE